MRIEKTERENGMQWNGMEWNATNGMEWSRKKSRVSGTRRKMKREINE